MMNKANFIMDVFPTLMLISNKTNTCENSEMAIIHL